MQENEQGRLRLLIGNDSQIVREGLRLLLSECPDIEAVGYARSLPEAFRLVGELQPDVLLIELTMQGRDGLRALQLIHGEWPQVALLVFTSHPHPPSDSMLRALRAGVAGFVPLSIDRAALLHAIRTAARGEVLLNAKQLAHLLTQIESSPPHTHAPPVQSDKGPSLTERELGILQGVASGKRNKEIASRLGISEPTVKSHLANIYYKLGVDSRAAAVAVALERRILSLL